MAGASGWIAPSGANSNPLVPGQYRMPIDLAAGWSEVLLKMGDLNGPWGFTFELVETDGHGLPHGIAITAVPQAPTAPPPAEKTP